MTTARATLCARDKEKPFILMVAIVVGRVADLPVLLSLSRLMLALKGRL